MARLIFGVLQVLTFVCLLFAVLLTSQFHSSSVEEVGLAFILRGAGRTIVTPANWSLILAQIVIILHQAAFLCYILSTHNRNPKGYILSYCDSLPDTTIICASLMNVLGISWIAANATMELSKNYWAYFVLTTTMALLGYIGLAVVLRGFLESKSTLHALGLKREVLLNTLLLQNGMATYFSWCLCAAVLTCVTCVKLALPDVTDNKAAAVTFIALAFIIFMHVVQERHHWEQHAKHVLSHYVMYVLMAAGILSNGDVTQGHAAVLMTSLVLFVAVAGLVAKVFCMLTAPMSVSVMSFQEIPADGRDRREGAENV